jgi:NAD(P)-dependent dehydrogenase (short-subunit alcohol dehydrogenase family)
MIEQGGGRIVNVCSLASILGVAGLASYTASKAGLAGLTRSAAVDYGKAGIRVNAILPGVIDTPMNDDNPPDMQAAFLEKTPVGRAGTAVEIAAAILFFASAPADFITGQCLSVDGGWSIQS